jgi:hypothetical protein
MRGVVYKIVDKREPNVVLYVGSTGQTLGERWRVHKQAAKHRSSKLYKHLREHGVNNFKLVPLEQGTFENISTLRKREEQHRLELNTPLNVYTCFTGLAGLDIINYRKQYYMQNQEATLERSKKYRAANRDQIAEKKKQQVCCDACGRWVTINHVAGHKRTVVHQRAIAALGVQI